MFDDCDNEGVTFALNGGPNDPVLYELCLKRAAILAVNNMDATARHFPGWANGMTDDLSRGRIAEFRARALKHKFQSPILLQPDKELQILLKSLALMVRDHKAVSPA